MSVKVEGPGGRWRPGLWALRPALQSKGSAGVRTMLRCCRPSWKDTDVPSWWWFRNNKIVWFWKIISQDVMECFDNRLIERAENCICSGRWASLGQGVSCARHPPPQCPSIDVSAGSLVQPLAGGWRTLQIGAVRDAQLKCSAVKPPLLHFTALTVLGRLFVFACTCVAIMCSPSL